MANLIVDGNWAAADVAYRCVDFAAIYPITPSSTMGELADEWSFQHKKNIWGAIPQIIEMESEGGAAGAMHGALQMGTLATTFTASQWLLLMIPNMYKIAGEQTPFVMHVAARALATHALSIFGDHSDVMAVRSTGFALLSSHNVQQAHDMAAIAHAATIRARVPFLHFFDGFRTSHEESRLNRIDDDVLRKMIPEDLVARYHAMGMNPDNPTIRGTAQNPDVYFQGREAANELYAATPKIVAECMDEFARLTGRRYGLVEYVGDKKAENVIVALGSACETIEETIAHLPAGFGLIKIHLYRPFPVDAFLAALPKGVKQIAVLDRTKEPGAVGEPLYVDVKSVVGDRARVCGGRYGLGSKEFKPRDVAAIFENMKRGTLHHNFTVGIDDDLTGLSLKTDPAFSIEDPNVRTAILYGIGSDGTVGAVKNIVKIVGENSELYPQSYAVYDSKKSGAKFDTDDGISKCFKYPAALSTAAQFAATTSIPFFLYVFSIAVLADSAATDGSITLVKLKKFSIINVLIRFPNPNSAAAPFASKKYTFARRRIRCSCTVFGKFANATSGDIDVFIITVPPARKD